MKRRTALLAIAGGAALTARAAEPDSIVVPRHENLQDPQISYFLELLHLALERSGRQYRLLKHPLSMVQSRSLIELARPEPSLDLFWTMSSTEREAQLLPIRIPLDRGLLGWRIALVRERDQERWQGLRQLAELANYRAGQMADWPDTAVLRANGLTVEVSTHFERLFGMLAEGRIDYFPRSVIEIETEALAYRNRGLVIEPYLLLHYPAPLYFFVSPRRPRLAAEIERGLESMIADGSFERLFQRRFGPTLSRLGLGQRRLLNLHNPVLPPATPLGRKELWLQRSGGS